MTTALVPQGAATTVIDRGLALPIAEVQARLKVVLDVMANVLEEGKDYGKVPGTDKPTLFKPGAEKLMLTFQLSAAEPQVEDLSTSEEIRYRVRVPIEAADGRVLAVGIGEASTNEEKYRWRRPVCDEEWTDAPADARREKWFKGRNDPYKGKQIRTSPADLANTVLKMAHKRGFVHATLLATAASSVFNQDLEDFNKELADAIIEADGSEKPSSKAQTKQPQRRSESKGGGSKKPAAAPAPTTLVTEPVLLEKVHRPEGKSYFVITVKDDKRFFTCFDAGIAKEADSFAGSDHKARVSYVEQKSAGGDKTYYNIIGVSIADATPTTAAAPNAPDLPLLTADDIPFGR